MQDTSIKTATRAWKF